jgi:hypothetical protein
VVREAQACKVICSVAAILAILKGNAARATGAITEDYAGGIFFILGMANLTGGAGVGGVIGFGDVAVGLYEP